METDRRQIRILAMQQLCQWDVQHNDLNESPVYLCSDREPTQVDTLADNLVQSFYIRRQEVDRLLSSASHNWALDRLSPVERNVIRIAITELLSGDVPPKVVMNEAIEISKVYGGLETPRFVNGILDMIARDIEASTEKQK